MSITALAWWLAPVVKPLSRRLEATCLYIHDSTKHDARGTHSSGSRHSTTAAKLKNDFASTKFDDEVQASERNSSPFSPQRSILETSKCSSQSVDTSQRRTKLLCLCTLHRSRPSIHSGDHAKMMTMESSEARMLAHIA